MSVATGLARHCSACVVLSPLSELAASSIQRAGFTCMIKLVVGRDLEVSFGLINYKYTDTAIDTDTDT